ncbi:MAG: hypothetical protein L6R42_004506 [Xanthoria sp. 1 TBL-2021]|nr:MAG: hypothetical protein L6R42_004506 [Xanthoria sp. 1 TBL-2021]
MRAPFLVSLALCIAWDPPGFSILIDLSTTRCFPPEKVLLAAITVIYDWAFQGYTHILKSGTVRYTLQTYDIALSFRSLALAPPHRQLEIRYLIFGLLHLIDKMRKVGKYCVSTASMLAFREPVGFIRLDIPRHGAGQNTIKLDNGTVTTVVDNDTGNKTVQLTVRTRIVDPKDPHFAISYELKGESMTWVDFLSGVLYALASAAQGDDEVCESMAGFNAQRTAVYMINGIRPTKSMYVLTYENVRRGLLLLATRLYGAGVCGEVEFSFEFLGDVLGGGRVVLNDFDGVVVG